MKIHPANTSIFGIVGVFLLSCALGCEGCAGPSEEKDAGTPAGPRTDSGPTSDAGVLDAGPLHDGGDAGGDILLDGGLSDASLRTDAGEEDAGLRDAGPNDAGSPDAGASEPSAQDAGEAGDAGRVDAGSRPDGGIVSGSDAGGTQAGAPIWPNGAVVTLEERGDVYLRLTWPSAVSTEASVRYILQWGQGAPWETDENAVVVTDLEPSTEYVISVYAVDPQGRQSDALMATVYTSGTEISVPPNVPEVDLTVPATFKDLVGFLAQDGSYQVGLEPDAIKPERESMISGIVHDIEGNGLVGARVTVVGHPEYGSVLTLEKGAWFFWVNGEDELIVRFEKEGYMPVQRRTAPGWRSSARVDRVVLQHRDETTSLLDLTGQSDAWQLATGSARRDCVDCEERWPRVAFPPGVVAEVWRNGAWQSVTEPSRVQLTEFTVGDRGVELMPGELPPNTAYTFAIDLHIHQGLEKKDGIDVKFVDENGAPTEVYFYGENFLSFPVGTRMPSGYYEPETDRWIPVPDGWVIQVTEIVNGQATIDAGDAELVLSAEERSLLGSFAVVGQSYMRMPLQHFSNYDFNCGIMPPPWATPPQQDPPYGPSDGGGGCSPQANGSKIDCIQRSVGQEIPIAGTALSLHYQSDRTRGYKGLHRVQVPLTVGLPAQPLASLVSVKLELVSAGRTQEWFWNCETASCENLIQEVELSQYSFDRGFNGQSLAQFIITYGYVSYYAPPLRRLRGNTFGSNTYIQLVPVVTRTPFFMKQRHVVPVGNFTMESQGLGGFSLSEHHVMDRRQGKVLMGNGTTIDASGRYPIIETLFRQGDRIIDSVFGSTLSSNYIDFGNPIGVHVEPDGSVLVGASSTNALLRISQDGKGEMLARAKTDFAFNCPGDSIDAPGNRVSFCARLLLGGIRGIDDRIYMTDHLGDYQGPESGSGRIKVFDPTAHYTASSIFTFAGAKQACSEEEGAINAIGDGCPANRARLIQPVGLTFGPDGSLYIAEMGGNRIRRIDPAGIIWTVAGDDDNVIGAAGGTGDGGRAVDALLNQPVDVLATKEGAVYVSELGGNRIRRIEVDGNMSGIAGTGEAGYDGDGLPATESRLAQPGGMTLRSNGELLIADGAFVPNPDGSVLSGNQCVRRLGLDGRLYDEVGRCGTFAVCERDANCGDQGPAAQALLGTINGISLDSEGRLFIIDHGSNRLRRVRSPHDVPNLANAYVIGPDGREVFVFSKTGRHLETLDAVTGQRKLRFTYYGEDAGDCSGEPFARGRVCQVIDAHDQEVRVEYGAQSAELVAPSGSVTKVFYDDAGYAERIRSGEVREYEFAYGSDSSGKHNGLMQQMSEVGGYNKTYSYSSYGRLVRAEHPSGSSRVFSTERYEMELSDQRSVWVREYQVAQNSGRVMSYAILPYERSVFPNLLVSEGAALSRGMALQVTYPDGAQSVSVRDAMSRQQHLRFASGRKEHWRLKAHPRFLGAVEYPETIVIEQGDAENAPRKTVTTTWSQSASPQNIWSLQSSTRTLTINDTAAVMIQYDDSERVITQTSAEGRVRQIYLDEEGRLSAAADAERGTLQIERDAKGAVAAWEWGDGEGNIRRTEIARAEEGALTRISWLPPQGDGLDYLVWPDGRVAAKRLRADDATVEVDYDDDGRFAGLVGPGDTGYEIQRDAFGRLQQLQFRGSDPSQPAQNMLGVEYNEDEQVLGVYSSEPSAGLQFSYGEGGQLISAVGQDFDTSYIYEAESGLLSSIHRNHRDAGFSRVDVEHAGDLRTAMEWTGTTAGRIDYQYDDFFHRVGDEIEFAGETFAYASAYDLDGKLTQRGAYSVEYSPTHGKRVRFEMGQIVRETEYNGFGEVIGENYVYRDPQDASIEVVIFEDTVTRDDLGFIDTLSERGLLGVQQVTYRYDGRSRLVSSEGDDNHTYAYDVEDNLIAERIESVTQAEQRAFSYDGYNQLVQVDGSTFEYDQIGRMTRRVELNGDTTTYAYDGDNQLREVTLPNGKLIRYTMDGLGNLIARHVNDIQTHAWLYDPQGRPVAQTTWENGQAQSAFFVYLGDGYTPAYMEQSGERYAFVMDSRQRIRGLVDVQSGVLRRSYTYDDWGAVREELRFDAAGEAVALDHIDVPFTFIGGHLDGDTGLVRMGARFYAPELRRWLTRDPSIIGKGQWNFYAYAFNNPISYVDENGRFGHIALGCAVGGLTTGLLSAAISGIQGYDAGCVLRAFGGGFVGGCVGGALGAVGGFIGSPMVSNGIGNVVSTGTNMLTGYSATPDTTQGILDELSGAFETGAVGGSLGYAGAGLQSGSAVLDDIVTNAAVTGAVAGADAARTFEP